MVRHLILSVFLCCAVTSQLQAQDSSDEGLKEGDAIGVFYVTKVAGAVEDGVEPGDDLCYRCRYGSQPMVMVFARQTGGKLPELAKQLDAAITKNEEAKLKGLLTLMGDDAVELKEQGKEIARASSVKKLPVVIAKDTKTGPLNYRLSSKDEVTIVLAKDSQVISTHVCSAAKIDLSAIMGQVDQMLD